MNFDCNICNFVDDTTLYACNKSIDLMFTEVENTLTSILAWFDKNGMVANPKIIQIIFFGESGY